MPLKTAYFRMIFLREMGESCVFTFTSTQEIAFRSGFFVDLVNNTESAYRLWTRTVRNFPLRKGGIDPVHSITDRLHSRLLLHNRLRVEFTGIMLRKRDGPGDGCSGQPSQTHFQAAVGLVFQEHRRC